MYFTPLVNNRPRQTNLLGFSDPLPTDPQKSLDAIVNALLLNPAGGYVVGSAARKKLQDAFDSVPAAVALPFGLQLAIGQGSLAKLFRYRLARPTRVAMLRILLSKATEFIKQELVDIQKREELRQKLCALERALEAQIQELCVVMGDDSVECRNARSGALKGREEDRRAGIQCP